MGHPFPLEGTILLILFDGVAPFEADKTLGFVSKVGAPART